VEPVEVVEHRHVERRRRRALLLVAAHVDVLVVRTAVGEAVDQPRIAVVGEDDRAVWREQPVELMVGHAVRMLGIRLEAHEVDHVHEPDLELRQVLAEQRRRGQRLERRYVAAAGEHDVRLTGLVVRRPVPDPGAARAMNNRVLHREEGQRGLLAGDDHVHVVPAAETVVGDREKRVGVGRQVDADHLGLLVCDVIDEARILVREAIVILAPDVRGQQVVEGRDRAPPRNLARHLQPLRVLVEHRVDDVDEGLVTVEEAVATGQEVALEPALAEVLGEDLEHAALRCELLVRRLDSCLPGLVRDLEDRAQPVRLRLVRPEQPEVLGIRGDHVAQEAAEDARRLRELGSGRLHLDCVVPEVRERQIPQQLAAVRVRVRAHPTLAARRQLRQVWHEAALTVEELVGPVAAHPVFEHAHVLAVRPHVGHRHLVGAPCALDRKAVDLARPRPALRTPEHDHRPPWPDRLTFLARASLDLGDLVERLVQHGCEPRVCVKVIVVGVDLDVERSVAVTRQESVELLGRDPCKHGRIRDLVSVQMQDRQHRAVDPRVQELVGMPTRCERSGLGLAVSDDAGDEQVGVVEGGAVGVCEGVAELSALVDRAGRLRRGVARDSARERELPE